MRKMRWLLVLALAVAGLAFWGWSQAQAGDQGEIHYIEIGPEENIVLHSPEELAALLRESGVDEASIQNILEFERRVDAAHKAGWSHEQLRKHMEQWIQELFPPPPGWTPEPGEPSSLRPDAGPVPGPLTWLSHTAPINACCSRVFGRWQMPGYRDFWAWFRATSGNLYIVHGYCPYATCTYRHTAWGETAWDYHVVSMWNTLPNWHIAGCY